MKYNIPSFTNPPSPSTMDFDLRHFRDSISNQIQLYFQYYYAIGLVLTGEVTYNIEGEIYNLTSGDIMLFNDKASLHTIDIHSVYERIIIWADKKYVRSLDPKLDISSIFKKNSLLRLGMNETQNIKTCLEKLEKEEILKNFGCEILRDVYFKELLILLYRSFYNVTEDTIEIDFSQNQSISQIVQYINNHLDSDLSLNFLSNHFNMDKYHMQREFKKNIGLPIYRFIRTKRLIYASSLLRKNLPVTQVCLECGFNDYANFIRSFTKEFEISPKEYAKHSLIL